MKKLFLSIVLLLTATISKSQNLTVMTVDSMCMFEYPDTMSFEDAWDNGNITNLGQIRRYNDNFKTWVISGDQITFGNTEPKPCVLNGDKYEYITTKGNTFKLFLKQDVNTGQKIVFFLENSKNGKIKGGFTYPTELVML